MAKFAGPVHHDAFKTARPICFSAASRSPIEKCLTWDGRHAGDPATRRAGAIALGEVSGAAEATTAMLGTVLRQRGESVRATAAEAIARIAQRDPKAATPQRGRGR